MHCYGVQICFVARGCTWIQNQFLRGGLFIRSLSLKPSSIKFLTHIILANLWHMSYCRLVVWKYSIDIATETSANSVAQSSEHKSSFNFSQDSLMCHSFPFTVPVLSYYSTTQPVWGQMILSVTLLSAWTSHYRGSLLGFLPQAAWAQATCLSVALRQVTHCLFSELRWYRERKSR